MKTIRDFLKIIDHQTIIVAVLTAGSTWACRYFSLEADMPFGLIGIAIVFPIVFSINAAYRRRESALSSFSDLKGNAVALHLIHRDWVPDDGGGGSHQARATELIDKLLRNIKTYFTAPKERESAEFNNVYSVFSEFSKSHELLRKAGTSSGEVSRAGQYVRAMMIDFEKMRTILRYRTPISLRAYSRVFLTVFPIVFGPYFAHLSAKTYGFLGYVIGVSYALVLVSLDNIQEDLENPFDAVGADDVNLDVADKYASLTSGQGG